MADHRRVEARSIIGTGMATDVDRLRDIEADKERKERAWRPPPEKGFGEVLTDAPPRGELEDESPDDPRKKKRAPKLPEGAPSSSAMAGAAVEREPSKLPPKPDLPKVAPDPRERALRAQLATNLARPKGPAPVDTPPTGSHLRKP